MTTCKHADSGCNYPEGGCAGVCMATSDRLIELVLQAASERSDREWKLMHLSLSEAAETAKILQRKQSAKATRSASHD